MTSETKKLLIAHLSMAGACAIWGLMAPLGKDAMTHGMDGITLVSFRVLGGMLFFWLTSLFVKHEHVPMRDKLRFAGAGLLGLCFNQCGYTIGLSLTSPVNASIVTTSMPIFAMILSAIILKEKLTSLKVLGVLIGCAGALILVNASAAASSDKEGNMTGDLLCLGAQLSYALYLCLFNPLVKRYSVFTVNKWMFLWATLIILPFSTPHVIETVSQGLPLKTVLEAFYVVFCGTYLGYILIMIGQHSLKPTVVSVYNYVQPIVSVSVSLFLGLAVLKYSHLLAIILVFSGVGMVIYSQQRGKRKSAKALAE